MKENKKYLLKGAMTFGVSMGIYWCIKYLFFITGYSHPSAMLAYEIMSIAVLVIAYYQTKSYREIIGGVISFSHAWRFGVLLYFFSSLILSVEQYIYYQYFAPPEFFTNLTAEAGKLLQQMNASPAMLDSINTLKLTPITMTIQGIFNNTFYGIIFSLPIAALVQKSGDNI